MNMEKHNEFSKHQVNCCCLYMRQLNQITIDQLKLKFRNVHLICKTGHPFTDYMSLCSLDEAKAWSWLSVSLQ